MPRISDRQAITILRHALRALIPPTNNPHVDPPCFCTPMNRPEGGHTPSCTIAREALRTTDFYERKPDA